MEKAVMDYASENKTAKEEGIAEERKKNAINMKNKGLENAFIAEC